MSKGLVLNKAFDIVNGTFMMILLFVTLYPILYVVIASFSDPNLLMAHQGLLLVPMAPNVRSYIAVFENPMILTGYLNTIYIVVAGVSINLVLTSLGAFALSRKDLYWKKFIMVFIVFTMFFSGGLIPFYLTVKALNLDNTLWAIMLPSAISTFNMIILRTGFEAIPDSIEESAKLDGAGYFTILLRIMVPLALPTIAVIVLYYAVSHWNSWFNAMIFIRNRSLYPLQLILTEILIQNDTNSMQAGNAMADKEAIAETIKYAVIMVATLPILSVYPFLQRFFVKGVMVGAVKE